MIHVLHGFLGSPADFAFLQGEGVKIYDLLDPNLKIEIAPTDTIIGYSMGGRIALELATKINFNLKRVILINANPGLESEEEKKQRIAWEDQVLEKMETLNVQDFFTYWNALPIFSHDQKLAPVDQNRYEGFKNIFDKFRLSNQPNYLPQVIKHLEKVLWVIGLQDEKYTLIAEERLLPHDIAIKGIEGGHRLFQNPEALISLLREENVL